MSKYDEALEKAKKYGQEQVFKYYDQLDDSKKTELCEQILSLDMDVIESCKHMEDLAKKGEISPIKTLELDEIDENSDAFTFEGVRAIADGKVAAMLLAGGMETRLGSDDPKGMYNVGVTKDLYIFQCLINNLLEVVNKTGKFIHLFVMTSDKNNDATIKFFNDKNFFGYKGEYVHFFKQEMAAATDYNGKIYLEEKGKLSTSPNGNGGWFVSLMKAGLLDVIHNEGIEWLNVFAVDNVLQRIADPVFVGATIMNKCEVGAKVVRKAAPDEKVGVICLEDGRPSIVEYYELTDELMNAKNEKGDPAYNFGVILNYLFNVAALERIAGDKMPLHIVEKKIPFLDESGNLVKPESPNGYKYESLVLDMIHEMDSCLPFEVDRKKEFAPIKNKTGIDSVESARELLKFNGVEI